MFVFNIFIQVIGWICQLHFLEFCFEIGSEFIRTYTWQVKLKVEDIKLSGRQYAADLPKKLTSQID